MCRLRKACDSENLHSTRPLISAAYLPTFGRGYRTTRQTFSYFYELRRSVEAYSIARTSLCCEHTKASLKASASAGRGTTCRRPTVLSASMSPCWKRKANGRSEAREWPTRSLNWQNWGICLAKWERLHAQ
jgi:hypothetical protein